MTEDENKRIDILNSLSDDLLQTKECKLLHSYVMSIPQSACRNLDYSDIYGINSIHVYITHKINNTYFSLIKVYISGTCYDYFRAPRGSAYPHIDIAFQIANYLKILGLQVYGC